MTSRNPVLDDLILRMRQPIRVEDVAAEEALRIMVRLGLAHPMTLAAAMKIVASEMRHGRLSEIEATARALHAKLLRRHSEPGTRQ
jgi:pilus assembly protein TadC